MTRDIDMTSPTTLDQTGSDPLCAPHLSPIPGLILIWKPEGVLSNDRAALTEAITVGRGQPCNWYIRGDRLLSRRHISIEPSGQGLLLRDLGARNGVFVNGRRVSEPCEVGAGTIVRAGSCLFALVSDLGLLSAPHRTSGVIAGRFHAGPLIHRLRVAARTGRHLLLEGESGTGKELAAQVVHQVWGETEGGGRRRALVAHNAACFAGEDDAVATLFGVSREAYSGVSERRGALEEAAGGTLFLDELHALPLRAQRSLLRFVEDGLLRPLGASGPRRTVEVRLVLGTNISVDRACDEGLLARDLVERFHRVTIPPLRERIADVPSIFEHVLEQILDPEQLDAIRETINAEVMERLCLHDYRSGNVRELQDLAALIQARLIEGEPPDRALAASLEERVPLAEGGARAALAPGGVGSPYERHRETIISTYAEVGQNVSKLARVLKARGVPCTRRWLTVKLKDWGVK